ISVHDIPGDGGPHRGSSQQVALCRGVWRHQFSQRARPGAVPGIDLAIPTRLHGHSAALHCAVGGAPLDAGRFPIPAESVVSALALALAGGPARQSSRVVGLSRPGSSVVFKSVRLAGTVSAWRMAGLAQHPWRRFLAQPWLVVLAGGGAVTGG